MHKTEGLVKYKIFYLRHIKTVMPHGKNMFQTAYDMAMSTMCAYPSSRYALPHWKFEMRCCAKLSCIYLPTPKSNQNIFHVSPKI